MALVIGDSNLVLLGRFEQLRGKYGLSLLTISDQPSKTVLSDIEATLTCYGLE